MGYDLIANKKNVESISFGAFSWPIMLQDTGAGYIIGYGAGLTPGTYVYQPRGNGGSPVSNDGYKITAKEASSMALCVYGYLSVSKFINAEWDKMPADQKEERLRWNKHDKIYTEPIGQKFIDNLERFAEFLSKCGGFKIR